MKQKKVLIFDWDGTLLDSTEAGYIKVEKTLELLGLEIPPREFLKKYWGMRADKLVELILQNTGNNDVSYDNFCEVYDLINEEYPSIEKTYESLIRLKSLNYKVGLITSRTSDSWLKTCKITNFDSNCFDFTQTATHFYHHKPSGRVFGPLLNWIKHHGFIPSETVYFGDTVDYDLKATQNSIPPIDFVGVVSGVNSRNDFLEAGVHPSRIINSCNEVPKFLNRLIQQKVEV